MPWYRIETASKLLREALPIAHEIRDEATARQIAELLAQTSRVEPTTSATLRPEGGVWHAAFNGTSVHVPDMKGLWHLRLGGRPRRTGSPTERARLNVTRTIRHAITHLSTALPELAAHLDESVATGVSCCYEPRTNIAWTT